MRPLRPALCLLTMIAASPAPAWAASPAPYVAADRTAPAIREENLLESERFWPYQVALASPWKPEGQSAPFRAGTLGVLVRVEGDGRAVLDFGSEGRYRVPVGKTDVVQRANEVRTGVLVKRAPNLAQAIATRLVDSEAERIGYQDPHAVARSSGFLAVFADPGAPQLAELASAIAPLRGRHGVMTVLVPQGEHPDAEVRERLRALDWRVPFVLDAYGEGYTRSLRGDGAPLPAVMLLSREGRVLYDRPLAPGIADDLAAALDRAFGPAPAAATAAR